MLLVASAVLVHSISESESQDSIEALNMYVYVCKYVCIYVVGESSSSESEYQDWIKALNACTCVCVCVCINIRVCLKK